MKIVKRRQFNKEEGFTSASVPCPEICEHYNQFKDAVDQFDKHCLRDNYSLEKSQVNRKWWMKLYWGLFDSAIVNCWILWKMGHGEAHKFQFMTSLQDAMLSYTHHKERNEEVKTRRSKLHASIDANRYEGVHTPLAMSSRKVCVFCQALNHSDRTLSIREEGNYEYKKPSRSRYKCDICNVALCVVRVGEEKNCFQKFHDKKMFVDIDHNINRRLSKKNKEK